jgi:hypothetical protein
MRDMIFVSHANLEDNEFALWLALRLATDGYPVWCDLTKLLGGEIFWDDIEQAIRQRTVKFLYVLSTVSNTKPGSRNELTVALGVTRKENLKDFVIPLRIDSLPPADFNVEIARINAIQFTGGWAAGLAALLKKLEEDGIAKKAAFGPAAVSNWWRNHASAAAGLKSEPEPLISNWYPLESTPLYFHDVGHSDDAENEGQVFPYPAVRFKQYLVSFAPAEDFRDQIEIRGTVSRTLNPTSVEEKEGRLWNFRDERATLATLLRLAWERLLAEKKLATFAFANGALGLYFLKDQIPDNRVAFVSVDGKRTRRDVVGYKTLKGAGGVPKGYRYWHFCLEAKPTSHPVVGYTMRSHVLFSDDGQTIWDNADRMHRARRSQCKMWWNDRWRDLISATVSWISAEGSTIAVPVGSQTVLRVAARPILLESPVSYDEEGATASEGIVDLEGIPETDDADEGDDRAEGHERESGQRGVDQ